MKEFEDYRVSVEIIIKKDNQILLTKRSSDCKVAPNRWCVPAGKVKYEEIPTVACKREAMEEVQMDVNLVKELCVRAFKSFDNEVDRNITYRLVFTFLVEIIGEQEDPILNNEHSEFCWVTLDELKNTKFDSMRSSLKKILLDINF
jgi:8-oxo-dGTP diphosphatase